MAALATLGLLSFAVFFLQRSLRGTSLADIEAQATAVPALDFGAAALLTGASYATLTLYDLLALHLIGKRLSYWYVAVTAFIAYALSNTLGLSSLSGGSVRLRAYTTEGLTALQIASVQVLCNATFVLGAIGMAGVAMLVDVRRTAAALHVSAGAATAIGISLVALVGVYVLVTRVRRAPLRFRRWSLQLPSTEQTLGQLAVSSLDLSLAGACLYVLLPDLPGLGFPTFLAMYILAITAGLISSVPGGVGVFESTLVLLLPSVPVPTLLGAVVVYRLVYYLAPFVLALMLLVARELRPARA